MIKFLTIIFSLYLSNVIANNNYIGKEFTVYDSFNVNNGSNSRDISVRPSSREDGTRVQVVEEINGMYKIRILGGRGVSDGEDYFISTYWGEKAFINEAVEDLESVLSSPETLGTFTDIICPEVEAPANEPSPDRPDNHTERLDTTTGGECDVAGTDSSWKANCRALFAANNSDDIKVPEGALRFALEGLKRNATSLRTGGCYKEHLSESLMRDHQSTPGLSSVDDLSETLSSGITNKCSMIINDHDDVITAPGGRTDCAVSMYYIDLCGSEPKVIKDYSYLGYGTCKSGRGYENATNRGTSLLGTFVTGNQSFGFGKQDEHYNRIRSNLGGTIPSVALYGLQGTNNRSAPDYKYLHVGAYTSAGCPSIDPSNSWMVDELAQRGPSMVVSYKEGEMEPYDACEEE